MLEGFRLLFFRNLGLREGDIVFTVRVSKIVAVHHNTGSSVLY